MHHHFIFPQIIIIIMLPLLLLPLPLLAPFILPLLLFLPGGQLLLPPLYLIPISHLCDQLLLLPFGL